MTLSFAGLTFDNTATVRPEALKVEQYRKGKPNLFLDIRQGDGPVVKPADRTWASWQDRVRADGYPSRFGYGTHGKVKLWYMPLENCNAPAALDWLNIFEIHAFNAGTSGPCKIGHEYSSGDRRPIDRVTKQRLATIGKANDAPVNRPSFVMKEGDQHLLEIEFLIHDTDGFVSVDKNFQRMAGEFSSGFGYGEQFKYGIHFGGYRNSRVTRTKMRIAIDECELRRA